MRRKIQNAVGLSAIVLLVLLVAFVFLKGRQVHDDKETAVTAQGSIVFEIEELVFDGTGSLDLMQGVVARSSTGKDMTEEVDAIITSDSTLSRKTVRYTFVDENGRTVSEKRTLVLKSYSGPSLQIDSNIEFESEDLKDLINVLKNRGLLKAEDGYGRDITSNVKCVREKKENGLYEMQFSVVNAYEDSKTVSITVRINGDVRDPEIKLSEKSATLRKNENFDALRYVVYSTDGTNENVSGKIQVDSSVDVSFPGDYRVVYRLYSADRTSKTTAVLKVRVLGD